MNFKKIVDTSLNNAHLITIKVTSSFPEYVWACKGSAKFIYPFRKLSPMPISDHDHPKIIKVISIFPESVQFIHSFLQQRRFLSQMI